ncbi:hypothetical protein CXIVA_16710 [Clostridium sp. SY8519]|uniref:HlyC/CorC family transporter n=1 Tax=Clostridium sp. (strain SY8519) TaxID=1042156 RepID=UPI0002171C6C|nr:hemolysin family protein [Clostridium sp. SY8519]BAK47637.1 hypothetical protein CXIVA_16710 [Clostridium sp. SY8519]
MDPTVVLKIIILICLLGCSAFFSASETALISVSRIRLRTLAEEGNRRAALTLKLLEHQSKMLSAILIGNNVANLSASSLATSIAMSLFGSVAVSIATGILTILVLIFGEITPKTIATYRAERLSMRVASIIYALMRILTPVIFVINALSQGILRLLGVDTSAGRRALTESEIRTIMNVGHEDGVIETEEKELINNVFDFGDTTAREVMIPRIDMTFLKIDASYDEILETYKECRHTRIPVYEDSTDNVVGILNVKDLLLCDKTHFSIKQLLRDAYFTFEHKSTSDLLIEMRARSTNMAIVLDDYGATAGLITLEDLLEEIVGDIRDEYDAEEAVPIQQIAENEYLIEGAVSLDDINEALGTDFSSENYDSIGGYMIEHFDRIPRIREAFYDKDGVFLQVNAKTNHRIDQVHIKLPKTLTRTSDA